MSEPTSRLGPVTLRTIAVSAMSNNVYLLTHTSTGAQVLIDAADDALVILMREDGLTDARREKVILDLCREPGFSAAKLAQANSSACEARSSSDAAAQVSTAAPLQIAM